MLILHFYKSACERMAYLESLRTPRHHSIESLGYVAVTLHDRERGDRAALHDAVALRGWQQEDANH